MRQHAFTFSMALVLGTALGGIAFAQGNGSPGTESGQMQQPSGQAGQMAPATPRTGATAVNPGTPNSPNAPSYQAGAAQVSPATVKEVQQQLKSDGLYKGPVDGRLGPETRAAVRQFQQKNGLKTTAMLDHETLQRLLNNQSNQSHG
jgi:peptidoglycan hydrolase-like protein with peptidoglycan-binding domain